MTYGQYNVFTAGSGAIAADVNTNFSLAARDSWNYNVLPGSVISSGTNFTTGCMIIIPSGYFSGTDSMNTEFFLESPSDLDARFRLNWNGGSLAYAIAHARSNEFYRIEAIRGGSNYISIRNRGTDVDTQIAYGTIAIPIDYANGGSLTLAGSMLAAGSVVIQHFKAWR